MQLDDARVHHRRQRSARSGTAPVICGWRSDRVPPLGPSDVLVDVVGCGVCATDLHLLDGSISLYAPPKVLGHEVGGVVRAVGSACDARAAGRRRGPGHQRAVQHLLLLSRGAAVHVPESGVGRRRLLRVQRRAGQRRLQAAGGRAA